jgi:hypothetical protein
MLAIWSTSFPLIFWFAVLKPLESISNYSDSIPSRLFRSISLLPFNHCTLHNLIHWLFGPSPSAVDLNTGTQTFGSCTRYCPLSLFGDSPAIQVHPTRWPPENGSRLNFRKFHVYCLHQKMTNTRKLANSMDISSAWNAYSFILIRSFIYMFTKTAYWSSASVR